MTCMSPFSWESQVVVLPWVATAELPYMAKHLRGESFVFRVENGYSLENFCGSMLIYCQSTRPNLCENIHD